MLALSFAEEESLFKRCAEHYEQQQKLFANKKRGKRGGLKPKPFKEPQPWQKGYKPKPKATPTPTPKNGNGSAVRGGDDIQVEKEGAGGE